MAIRISSLEHLTTFRELFEDRQVGGIAMAYAAGVAIGNHLPLPSSIAQTKEQEFNEQLMNVAYPLLSKANELIIFDTDYATKIMKATYEVRVNILFPSDIYISEDECINCDIFGISKAFKDIDTTVVNGIKPKVNELIRYIKHNIIG